MSAQPEEKIRVNARIPKSLYDFVCSKYDNISQAINIGLENLREPSTEYCHTPADSSIHDDIQVSHTSADTDICPDIQVLTTRIEEKDKQIEEKDRHIESLKGELDNLRSVHNNYMLQMQTLINQKAIEAPGAKKPWWRFW
jgi:chromosome segregation ATPase